MRDPIVDQEIYGIGTRLLPEEAELNGRGIYETMFDTLPEMDIVIDGVSITVTGDQTVTVKGNVGATVQVSSTSERMWVESRMV